MKIIWLLVFWVMQIAANLLFKYGASVQGKYWFGFIAGNLLGVSSIFVMMKIYTLMAPSIACGLAGGGAFLFVQGFLALVFRQKLSVMQYAGILAICLGMWLVSVGKAEDQCSCETLERSIPQGAPGASNIQPQNSLH